VTENEEARFRSAVSNSWRAVWAVAQHIHRHGERSIQVQPYRLRPSFDQRADYGDAADLLVCKGGDSWLPIEVKWRGLDFSGVEDFPFPTIFIDRAVKSQSTQPVCYFMVNRGITHAARIDWRTHDHWIGPNTYHDAKKGYEVTVYECPLNLVHFLKLTVVP
jgi:hypothetical protein